MPKLKQKFQDMNWMLTIAELYSFEEQDTSVEAVL